MSAALIGLYALQGMTSLAGAYAQTVAMRGQRRYERTLDRFNLWLLQQKEQDALKRGDLAYSAHVGKVRQAVGTGRASYAGQGVQVDTGSAGDVAAETTSYGMSDAVTIRTNAQLEAWGFRTQQTALQSKSRFDELAYRNQRRNTLITGGLNFINSIGAGVAKGM